MPENVKPPKVEQIMKRYHVIGGNPFRMHTGTTTFTSFDILLSSDSLEEANQVVNDKYEECCGLIGVLDAETGSLV
jgi:hypothetical protein